VEEGANSVDFTKLVEWATKELSSFTGLDEHVQSIGCMYEVDFLFQHPNRT